MAKINKAVFDYCLENEIVTDIGLCGLYAVSQITELPLNTVYYDYKKRFNMPDGWEGVTSVMGVKCMLAQYGYNVRSVITKGCKVKSFHENNPGYEGDLLLCVISRHIFLMMGNVISDQGVTCEIDIWNSRNCNIQDVFEVIENG